MDLSDYTAVRRLLAENGFTFKKSLGQNFLIDGTVCPAMAAAACSAGGGVLEIGPGAGVLTVELARRTRRVVAVEVDERLRPVLQKTLADFPHAEVVFGDVMQVDLAALIAEKFADCATVTVCANLPYYITSPILMMLLQSRLPIESITVMVQREAADRICAAVGSRAAGAVTAAVQYYARPVRLLDVPRESFLPAPKVDSAVITLQLLKNPPVAVADEAWFFQVVKASFALRRKTLCNSLTTLGIEKSRAAAALDALGLPAAVRGEALTLQQFAALAAALKE